MQERWGLDPSEPKEDGKGARPDLGNEGPNRVVRKPRLQSNRIVSGAILLIAVGFRTQDDRPRERRKTQERRMPRQRGPVCGPKQTRTGSQGQISSLAHAHRQTIEKPCLLGSEQSFGSFFSPAPGPNSDSPMLKERLPEAEDNTRLDPPTASTGRVSTPTTTGAVQPSFSVPGERSVGRTAGGTKRRREERAVKGRRGGWRVWLRIWIWRRDARPSVLFVVVVVVEHERVVSFGREVEGLEFALVKEDVKRRFCHRVEHHRIGVSASFFTRERARSSFRISGTGGGVEAHLVPRRPSRHRSLDRLRPVRSKRLPHSPTLPSS